MANPKSDTTTTTIDREPQPMIQLPVININISDRSGSGSGNNDGDDGAVGKAMLEAATRYGFFYIDHDHDDDACGDSEGGGDYFSVEDVDWMFELVCILLSYLYLTVCMCMDDAFEMICRQPTSSKRKKYYHYHTTSILLIILILTSLSFFYVSAQTR
jgi:hypothetical protein